MEGFCLLPRRVQGGEEASLGQWSPHPLPLSLYLLRFFLSPADPSADRTVPILTAQDPSSPRGPAPQAMEERPGQGEAGRGVCTV